MTDARAPQVRSLYLVFAGMGVSAALVPSSLPLMAADLGVLPGQLLGAVPALFGGLFTGVVASPLIARHVSVFAGVRAGVLVQGAGLAWFALSPSSGSVVFSAAVIGLGFGITEVTASAMARQVADAGTTGLLTRLMLGLALTASTAPVAVVVAGQSAPDALRALMFAATIYHVACGWMLHDSSAAEVAAPPMTRPAVLRHLPVGAVVAVFLYVGVESVLAGWSAVSMEATLGLDASTAALGTSAFWVLISVGRLVSPWLQRHVGPIRTGVTCTGLMVTGLGAAAAIGDRSGVTTAAMLAVAVVACGPCYALFLGGALTAVSESAAPSAAAVLVGVGAAGGALVPLAATFNSGSAAAWVAFGAAALLLMTAAVSAAAATPVRPRPRRGTS